MQSPADPNGSARTSAAAEIEREGDLRAQMPPRKPAAVIEDRRGKLDSSSNASAADQSPFVTGEEVSQMIGEPRQDGETSRWRASPFKLGRRGVESE